MMYFDELIIMPLLFNMLNLMRLRCFLYLKCDELFMIINVNNVLH